MKWCLKSNVNFVPKYLTARTLAVVPSQAVEEPGENEKLRGSKTARKNALEEKGKACPKINEEIQFALLL